MRAVLSSGFGAETPPLAHAGLCWGFSTGLTDAVESGEKEGKAMSPFSRSRANALYPGMLWQSAGYHGEVPDSGTRLDRLWGWLLQTSYSA